MIHREGQGCAARAQGEDFIDTGAEVRSVECRKEGTLSRRDVEALGRLHHERVDEDDRGRASIQIVTEQTAAGFDAFIRAKVRRRNVEVVAETRNVGEAQSDGIEVARLESRELLERRQVAGLVEEVVGRVFRIAPER